MAKKKNKNKNNDNYNNNIVMGMDRAKDIWRNPSNLSAHQKKMMVPYILELPSASKIPRWGCGFGFQMMGMIEWGQKSKLKKIPGPKISLHLKKKINKNSLAEFPSSLDSNVQQSRHPIQEHRLFHMMQNDNFRLFWIAKKHP